MSGITDSIYQISPPWLQNLLISAYGYQLYRKRYTGLYHDIRRSIDAAKILTRDELEAYQAERLHQMVKYCRGSIPYYQKLLADWGLSEQDFTHTRDLTKLPVLDKQTIRKRANELRNPEIRPYMVQHTSGSTGTPLVLNVDEYTYKLAMALVVDHEEQHGVRFGARRATFAGRMIQPVENMNPPFSRYNRAENQRLFSSYHINNSNFPHYQRELDRFAPEEIIGYPSAIYDIASQYHHFGVAPQFRPKVVITNSETLMDWQRTRIETVFNCPVRDYYGTAEYVLFSGQCSKGMYHLNPVIGMVETVDTEDRPVTDTAGEILATSLTNKAMPLLRYRIGDTAILGSKRCACDSDLPYFRQILGRTDDVILTEDGKRIGRIDHIFKGLSGIQEAQVIQERLNRCRIKVVTAQPGVAIDEALLKQNLLTRTGQSMQVDIEYTRAIERGANGKFKGVVSLVGDTQR
ncbi:phenylacetate--CoA ligase family protein [Saccharospirillum salsuginis]|uniref:Capsular polysaccharide biosynthesis protein CapK n=1 Tax=Saccharospirillum salsuginis TaxID=418750 RepID=A0A918K7G9_9GAMM|nr:phenylacetate--CoA ligase family protein [Saccharospirillum salsuginis]GGX49699.1 capsular polysaccharide biosynthesis protein CapK [Saccharospirillum salsuginis]